MSFEEQIMSKDKYPSIFSSKIVAIVFIMLQIFFPTLAIIMMLKSPSQGFSINCM